MTSGRLQRVTITLNDGQGLSGLLVVPPTARAGYVIAHGAGAGMEHPFMGSVAQGLAERGVATLRYQFPYMQRGSKRPDAPKVAHAAVRAAVAAMTELAPDLSVIAGGKSYGGRMTSQAHAVSPLGGVRGLAFLGFPLHPAGRPSEERGTHLFEVRVPMLFLQGSRDRLADLQVLQPLVTKLGARATLKLLWDADHSFHVRARTGGKEADVRAEMLDVLARWIEKVLQSREAP
jgi:predicted alpha/beta-hydrolase family hydrolase